MKRNLKKNECNKWCFQLVTHLCRKHHECCTAHVCCRLCFKAGGSSTYCTERLQAGTYSCCLACNSSQICRGFCSSEMRE